MIFFPVKCYSKPVWQRSNFFFLSKVVFSVLSEVPTFAVLTVTSRASILSMNAFNS